MIACNSKESDGSSPGRSASIGKKESVINKQLVEDTACRSHFLEMLIRIAKHRYSNDKKCNKVSDAFKRFMNDIVNPFYKRYFSIWENFRQSQLWSLDIDDLFKSN